MSDQILTCWPKGFLTEGEADALLRNLDETDTGEDGLTVEEEMAREKLIAATHYVPVDDEF